MIRKDSYGEDQVVTVAWNYSDKDKRTASAKKIGGGHLAFLSYDNDISLDRTVVNGAAPLREKLCQ